MALANCSDGALLMVTNALVPLKDKALPYLPEVVHVAPLMVPLFPLPDASVTIVPDPSLKAYAATGVAAWASGPATQQSKPAIKIRQHLVASPRPCPRTNKPSPSPPRWDGPGRKKARLG